MRTLSRPGLHSNPRLWYEGCTGADWCARCLDRDCTRTRSRLGVVKVVGTDAATELTKLARAAGVKLPLSAGDVAKLLKR